MRQAGHPVRPLRFHEQRVRRIHNLLAALRGYKSSPLSGTVLSLGAPPVGQLPCPVNPCVIHFPHSRPLRSLLPRSLRSLRSSWSLRFRSFVVHFPHRSTVHPLPHFVRHLPAAVRLSNDLASAVRRLRFAKTERPGSGPTIKADQRVAARRPSASPRQHGRPRGGGGDAPVRPVLPSLPSRVGHDPKVLYAGRTCPRIIGK
jgi:hypothetical protein